MSECVVGVDGGGTKTAVVVMAPSGHLLGHSVVGSTNWNSVGTEAARTHLALGLEEALRLAQCAPSQVRGICVGAAGVDRPRDRERLLHWLAEILPGVPALVYNDAVIALAAGTQGNLYGVVLISGTGMIVYGFNRDGQEARAGGWGALLGDEGSGYALGAAALKAVTWAADGRGPETALAPAVLARLGLDTVEDLIDWAYQDMAWERFANLAPVAVTCAAEGDPVAEAILDAGAEGLAVAVDAVIRRLGLRDEAFPLILAGGTLRSPAYAERVRARLLQVAPGATVQPLEREPAEGAAWLALQRWMPPSPTRA